MPEGSSQPTQLTVSDIDGKVMILSMDKLNLTRRNLGRVFKFRRGCLHAVRYGTVRYGRIVKRAEQNVISSLISHRLNFI